MLWILRIAISEPLLWIAVIVIIRLGSFFTRRKKGILPSIWHEAGVVAFLFYFVILIQMTAPILSFVNGLRLYGSINLIPLHGIWSIQQNGSMNYLLMNIIGNMVLFLPFGFSIPLLWPKIGGFIRVFVYGIGLSAVIEILQLFIGRSTDVDDLILNAFGVLVGLFIYFIFKGVFPSAALKFYKVNQITDLNHEENM